MGPGNGFLVTGTLSTGTETLGVPMPTVGTLSNLQVHVKTGPVDVTDLWTFNVCVNEDCATAMQCTITGTGGGPIPTLCSDNIDTANFSAGDRLTIQAVPTNGSALPPTQVSFSATFAP
jgi:hypothetical protein